MRDLLNTLFIFFILLGYLEPTQAQDNPSANALIRLIVNDGTGDGEYPVGTQVTITANAPAAGMEFWYWDTFGGPVTVADRNVPQTTLTIPNVNTTAAAIYKVENSHELNVQFGWGSGMYVPGELVQIEALAIQDKAFSEWVGGGDMFADRLSAQTTITMGKKNVTITALFQDPPTTLFALTINGGSGSGNYTAGTSVNINANTSRKIFDHWEVDGRFVQDVMDATTTLIMPSRAASVTAVYKPDPDTTVGAPTNLKVEAK